MLLGEILAEILKEYRIETMHLDKLTLYKISSMNIEDYFQALSILLLNRKIGICIDDERPGKVIYEKNGIKLIHGIGDEISRYYVRWRDRNCRIDITEDILRKLLSRIDNVRNRTYFIIDLSFWDEHTENERNELVEQIVMCIKTIRKYLYDNYLILTSCSDDFIKYFNRKISGMSHHVVMTSLDLRTFLRRFLRKHNVVMLDPEGDFTLTDVDVLSYDVYILGGIIDKERVDKYGTYRLYSTYRLWELNIPRMRICIDCSVIGVPDRLNKIMDIILRCRICGNLLRCSIILNQSKRDRIYRWYFEIQRYSKKVVKNGRVIKHILSKELINRLLREYPISSKDIERIFRSLNLEIV